MKEMSANIPAGEIQQTQDVKAGKPGNDETKERKPVNDGGSKAYNDEYDNYCPWEL
jgi:hypothetical protein